MLFGITRVKEESTSKNSKNNRENKKNHCIMPWHHAFQDIIQLGKAQKKRQFPIQK